MTTINLRPFLISKSDKALFVFKTNFLFIFSISRIGCPVDNLTYLMATTSVV